MIDKSEAKTFVIFLVSIVIFSLMYSPLSNIINENFPTDNSKLIAGIVLLFILAYLNKLDKFI